MKLTMRRQDLQRELALTQGVVELKATIPILTHVLLRGDKEGVELLATDLSVGLLSRSVADVTAAGAATLPAKVLHDVVRALDCDVVSLETESNHWLRVEGGSYRGRVAGLPAEDYPAQPAFPTTVAPIKVSLVTFQEMVSRVLFAVTTENTRFAIGGALLACKDGMLTLVSTDGHRLAHLARPLDGQSGVPDCNLLVARKALQELLRIPPKDENDEVEIAADGNHVFFRVGTRTMFSRVLEGSFPNYERVIPTDSPFTAKMERAALQSVISRIAILTSDASRQVTLTATKGRLTVATVNPSMGEASEELAVEYSGDDVKIALNCEYILQFLAASRADKLELRLKSAAAQALFVPIADGPWEYRYVVMPMRTS